MKIRFTVQAERRCRQVVARASARTLRLLVLEGREPYPAQQMMDFIEPLMEKARADGEEAV